MKRASCYEVNGGQPLPEDVQFVQDKFGLPKNKGERIFTVLTQNEELRIKPYFTIYALQPENKSDSLPAGRLATLFIKKNWLILTLPAVFHIYGIIQYITKQF